MPGRKSKPLCLSSSERNELELLASQKEKNSAMAERANIILHQANGYSQNQIARMRQCSKVTVSKWLSRYRKSGILGLQDKRGQGSHLQLNGEIVHEIMAKSSRPPAKTDYWTTRSMAAEIGVSPSTVSRIWRKYKITPATRKRKIELRLRTDSSKQESEDLILESEPNRVTQRFIAKLAGVSPITVSRALTNRPNVRNEVKARIIELAKKLKYRPDPQIKKLMLHLRKKPISNTRSNICCLEEFNWKNNSEHYFRPLVTSAKTRAEEKGFSWISYPLENFLKHPDRSLRILRARGVEGIFLPPIIHTCELPLHTDWENFSVIAATASVVSPVFQRVVPNHFRNMSRVCEILRNRGYQKLGLGRVCKKKKKKLVL